MSQVDAIFRHGVFEPLEPVNLNEEQRVRLNIQPAGKESLITWLNRVRLLQASVIARKGYLPDSTAEISADRMR